MSVLINSNDSSVDLPGLEPGIQDYESCVINLLTIGPIPFLHNQGLSRIVNGSFIISLLLCISV